MRRHTFAALDIGTNTLLTRVVRLEDDASHTLVDDFGSITRLGEGVDRTGVLSDAAITRALEALASAAERARACGATTLAAVATSAVRDARNGHDFVARARAVLGGDVRVIDGAEEAALTFEGATPGLPFAVGDDVRVFDVGGGSTEWVDGVVGGAIRDRVSLQLGSVRMTERFFAHDPPTASELDAAAASIRATLAARATPATRGSLIGVAATVATLAAMHAEIPHEQLSATHGARLDRTQVDRAIRLLAGATRAERRQITSIDPGRADLILAGALIVRGVFDWTGDDELLVSCGGVRVGCMARLLATAPR